MTTTNQGEHAQTEALDDLYLKLHGMSKRLESSGRIDESDAPEAYPAILDAMNLVRRLQCESAQVCRKCGGTGHAPAADAVAGPDDDDSLMLCASDLEHSAIYDNHVEMQSCIRAVAARVRLLAAAPTPAAQADSQPAPVQDGEY